MIKATEGNSVLKLHLSSWFMQKQLGSTIVALLHGMSENFKKLSQQTSKSNNYTATNEWKLQSRFPSQLLSPHHPCYLLLSPSSNEFLQGTCSSSLPPHLGTRAISISPSASISTWISYPDTISNSQNCPGCKSPIHSQTRAWILNVPPAWHLSPGDQTCPNLTICSLSLNHLNVCFPTQLVSM